MMTNEKTMTARDFYTAVIDVLSAHDMREDLVAYAEGAIAKLDAKQFIFDEEYFMNFGGMDAPAYKNGFVGLTTDTWTGEQAVIATATMTSNAVKESTTDAFASFNSIKNGGAN